MKRGKKFLVVSLIGLLMAAGLVLVGCKDDPSCGGVVAQSIYGDVKEGDDCVYEVKAGDYVNWKYGFCGDTGCGVYKGASNADYSKDISLKCDC